MNSTINFKVICGVSCSSFISFPFIHPFLPLLCWQKCLYILTHIYKVCGLFFFSWFPLQFFFLFHSHLIIWRWIWVMGNFGMYSHIFHITSLILTNIKITFWWNVTTLHHTQMWKKQWFLSTKNWKNLFRNDRGSRQIFLTQIHAYIHLTQILLHIFHVNVFIWNLKE